MYFVLSKVLLFLICPLLWVFALLVIALLAKSTRRRKRFLIASVIVLYIFSVPFFLNVFAHAWAVSVPATQQPKTYSCAIVLGGFSGPLSNGDGFFNGAADRFIQGMKVIATGKAKHILITGGNGSLFPGAFSEGKWVKTQLEQLKVPDSSILIESQSRNTVENAEFSRPILQKARLEPPYLLITSDFHMRRAYMIFRNKDYDVMPYPCNYMAGGWDFNIYQFIPDGGAIGGWNTYIKELVGYIVDSWK
jgi:uncharacterized SAM-binding protein YcdF (DUF218 family)